MGRKRALRPDLPHDSVKNRLLFREFGVMTRSKCRFRGWSWPVKRREFSAYFQGRGFAHWLLVLVVFAVGCAAADTFSGVDSGVEPTGPRVVFQLSDGTMSLGNIPYPDDLYRDQTEKIRVAPGAGQAATSLVAALYEDQAQVGGFGTSGPIFVAVDGEIDPGTLPATPQASMQPDASVFLLDIDPSSPSAFSRVPIQCRWNASEMRIVVRTARGEPLSGGRKYALVVTTRVLDPSGAALRPSEDYEVVLASSGMPSEPSAARVYRAHVSALSALANVGLPRSQVAGQIGRAHV